MGYYTHFTLEVEGNEAERFSKDFEQGLIECEYGNLRDLFYRNDAITFIGHEPYKWYDFEGDMIRISRAYPNTTFILHGNGEDETDFWRGYFRNGKSKLQSAVIAYPEEPIDLLDDHIDVNEDDANATAWM